MFLKTDWGLCNGKWCGYLEGIEPRGSYYGPDRFLNEENRISIMLVLVLVVGASVRRVVFSWHDILSDFVHHSVFEVWGERGRGVRGG